MSQLPPRNLDIELPDRLAEIFHGPARYRGAFGGRGSTKSWGFGRMALVKSLEKKRRILCARELQTSIKDSVLRLLIDQIELLGLQDYFDYGESYLWVPSTGSRFLFKGLRSNSREIKSMEKVDIAWIEEAQAVSKSSWKDLTPTIRAPGSEIWLTFNPDEETDPTYQRFVVNPPPNSKIIKINFDENPWMPPELEEERLHMLATDTDAYDHVWLGNCRKNSHAQIMRGKYTVHSFETPTTEMGFKEVHGPYYGGDWGFSQDPSVLVKLWITEDGSGFQDLWIEYEFFGIGVDIDLLPEKFETIPGATSHIIRADSARPETIAYMQKNGFPQMKAAKKWAGCVEDGVAFLRSFRQIHIHTRCENIQQEARLYSFKVDKLTGDPLAEIVDKHNHGWDSVRYALERLIRKRDDSPDAGVSSSPASSGGSFLDRAVVA